MKKIILVLMLVITLFWLASCGSDANIASHNLSKAADMFEIDRRIVFYNWITWEYMLTIEGKCSLWNFDKPKELTVTCKTWPDKYKKHFLGLSDNVTYFAEQLESKWVNVYHNRIIFKPQSIIPDIDFRWSTKNMPKIDNKDN